MAAPASAAQVAELVDALASGASGRKVVEVRVFSWAPILQGMPDPVFSVCASLWAAIVQGNAGGTVK